MPETTQDKQMLIQPNSITRAHYRLSIHQKHIVLMALGYLNTTIVNRDKDGITFDIQDMHKASGSKMQMSKYIKTVKKAVSTINNNPLRYIEGENTEVTDYWLTRHKINPGTTTITIFLSDKIAEAFSQISRSYTQCLLKYVFLLKTIYAARIYELAMQYKPKYKAVPIITLDEFRLLLGIEDKYKTYNELQRFVLNPALEEINAVTDIELSFRPERLGRFVTAIRFHYKFKSEKHEQEYIPKKKPIKAPQSTRQLQVTTDQLQKKYADEFAAKIA